MSVQWGTTLRNALLDQITTQYGNTPHIEIWSGSAPANCAAASTGTKLAKFDVAGNVGTYDDAAASGSKNILAAASVPISTTGLATGTAGYYRVFKSDDTTCVEQGTVTASGGGGDMTIDNTTINSGQTVQITGFTKTAPGA
jgi:hypothetical protein